MAEITTLIEGDLLTITVIGNLTANELIYAFNTYYTSGKVKDVIWDLTDGSSQSIPIDEFKAIAYAAKLATFAGSRKGGKTVFVGNTACEYNIFQLYKNIAELSGVPAEYKVFRTIEGAKCWLSKNALETKQL
ncbi:MAG: hypothetical protein P4L79_06290 [Legionella sp.]|uniref:hypothetical protein n=1 Tax=Legionella sp. TaxID=459 RepID=UPI00284AB2F5|nr:hypothetical protein [Legionella sp.]